MHDRMISPRYAVLLGAACGFFLVGTLLAIAVLIGDFGSDSGRAATLPAKRSVTEEDAGKIDRKIAKFDEAIADFEARFAKMTEELAAAKAKAQKDSAKPVEKSDAGNPAGGSSATEGSSALPDYSGKASAPAISMADPAVVGALAALNLGEGHEQEWKEAVQEIHRELYSEELRDGRDLRTDRIVALFEKNLHLSESQKTLLRDIRKRESQKLADLYSRVSVDNNREIRAEMIRVQFASAEEFKRELNAEQAARVGKTLNGLQ